MESPSPTTKVQLQRLLGKINFLRRFIANLANKIQPLTPLLKLKDKEEFEWAPPHQEAFDSIKAYLASPQVFMPPQRGKPLKLYISAFEKSIGSLLAQNNKGREEQAIYYLSRILIEMEARYIPVEKLCLALFLGTLEVASVWIPSSKAFLGKEEWIQQEIKRIASLWVTPWKLYFDDSCTQTAAGARIVIIDPIGAHHYYSFLLDYQETTNNRAKYEALIIGLEILIELGAIEVEVFGDSDYIFEGGNAIANEMAQLAFGA
ncbi:uncharacterized protein [Pyrus communis]|uniref:uncharacterized protein n=1 Tax=Pyrus communis TaxID=23211 RepID=UPI0035C1B7C7